MSIPTSRKHLVGGAVVLGILLLLGLLIAPVYLTDETANDPETHENGDLTYETRNNTHPLSFTQTQSFNSTLLNTTATWNSTIIHNASKGTHLDTTIDRGMSERVTEVLTRPTLNTTTSTIRFSRLPEGSQQRALRSHEGACTVNHGSSTLQHATLDDPINFDAATVGQYALPLIDSTADFTRTTNGTTTTYTPKTGTYLVERSGETYVHRVTTASGSLTVRNSHIHTADLHVEFTAYETMVNGHLVNPLSKETHSYTYTVNTTDDATLPATGPWLQTARDCNSDT